MEQLNAQHNDNWLQEYIERNLGVGKFAFEANQAIESCGVSSIAFKRAADRLKKKGKLLNLRPGLFVPIPPEYRKQGSPPFHWFIDPYMKIREANYYVGLLTAATFHGATHQAAQVFQVVASKQIKSVQAGNDSIQFFTKKNIEIFPSQKMKTETGYFNVSTPEVTAFDLLKFHKQAGGYHHVITVLHELAENLDPEEILKVSNLQSDLSFSQRLGHILTALGFEKKCLPLKNRLRSVSLPAVPLVPVRVPQKKGHEVDEVWNVIVNETLESDL